jgi:hypothetical protein
MKARWQAPQLSYSGPAIDFRLRKAVPCGIYLLVTGYGIVAPSGATPFGQRKIDLESEIQLEQDFFI